MASTFVVKTITLTERVPSLDIVLSEKDFASASEYKLQKPQGESHSEHCQVKYLEARYSALAHAVCRVLDLPIGSVNVSSNKWVVGSRVNGTMLIIARKKRRELRNLERARTPAQVHVPIVKQTLLGVHGTVTISREDYE